jgi:arylamine N-acetyltransferase
MSLEDLETEIRQDALEALRKIQLWQLATMPFGNLGLHYSSHHTISLDAETLFVKLVERRLGGYCMENNAFFATVLRSLGYDLYTTGGRVSCAIDQEHQDPEGYSGWSHMLSLVTIHSRKFLVDVGFGSTGSTQPVHLQDGELIKNVPTSEGRLLHKSIAPATDTSQMLWVFEVRSSPESPWIAQYCFSELEFLPQDFSVMNYYISQSRTSWFTQKLFLTKVLLSEDQKRPVGNLTLFGDAIRQRLHGQSETLMTCKSEEERVQALEKYFGVQLRPDEIRGIQGLSVEIRQPWAGS